MKLQKLLYYVCRDYAQRTGDTPITELFEVWKYGPVLPSVYGQFQSFRADPITEYAKDAMGRSKKVSEDKNPVLAEVLDIVWAKYKRYSGRQLSAMIHEKNSGWYAAYVQSRTIITVEDMIHDQSGK